MVSDVDESRSLISTMLQVAQAWSRLASSSIDPGATSGDAMRESLSEGAKIVPERELADSPFKGWQRS